MDNSPGCNEKINFRFTLLLLTSGTCCRFYQYTVLLLLLSGAAWPQSYPDAPSPATVYYFYEPYPMAPGATMLQLGGSFTLLPVPVVETEYPAPAIDVQYKHGMLPHMSLVGSFSTNYFSNLLHLGVQYNAAAGGFSLGLAGHVGAFLGFISAEGQFENNLAHAVFLLPIARFGYRFPQYSVSMAWAVSYIFNSKNKVSGLTAEGTENKVNDFFCTLAVEQPFLKNQLLSIGISLTYSRTPYQSWLLFNTIDNYLFLPEFFFSFQL